MANNKVKAVAKFFAVIAVLAGVVYYGGVRAVAFIAKMHGG